jgi:ketosteroid isomerase-like protein
LALVSQQNLEIVRDHYAATNERDFARAMSCYAEDVEMVVPSGVYIDAGTISGREAVGEWFGEWFATFDRDARFEIERLVEVGDSSVLVIARHHARGRASGATVEGDVIWLYRLQGGKIVHLLGFETRAEALRAVGLER